MTVIDVVQNLGKWTKATYNGKIGYVLTSYLNFNYENTSKPTPPPTVTDKARVETPKKGTLTLRESQSSGANALALIPYMTVIDVIQNLGEFTKVIYNGKIGYVLTSCLNFNYESSSKPTPPPTVTDKARVETPKKGTLTLRESQSTGAKALAYIPNMTVIDVISTNERWTKTTYNGKIGYVLSIYLNFNYNPSTVTPTPSPTPTTTPVTPAPPATTIDTARVKTTGGTLTLRERESTGAKALAYIPNNTVLNLTSVSPNWCKTSYNGHTGYVLSSFLNFTYAYSSNSPAQSQAQVVTTGGTLSLRVMPSTRSSALKLIQNKTVVDVLEKGSYWSIVRTNGQIGYVLSSYLNFKYGATPTPPPTSNPPTSNPPTPTDEPGYDTETFNRVLRLGYSGEDVRLVRERLNVLNYISTVTNYYDSTAVTAVKLFQKVHGLDDDGLAGKATFKALFSDSAIPYSPEIGNYKTLSIYYGSIDKTEIPDVTRLQEGLRKLGYPVSVTGTFAEATHNAVVAFQLRNGLNVDGIAGPSVQTLLFSGKAKGYSAAPSYTLEDNAGYMAAPATSSIKLLHWFNEIKPSTSSGSKLLIFDPRTNLSWTLRTYAMGRHADSEPLTLRDTMIMNKSFGKTGWDIHPVYVKLPSGQWTMATMHNRPHLSGSITNNGFDGHLCVHFLRDMDECMKNDPNYGVNNQNTLRAAWKNLTGEIVE